MVQPSDSHLVLMLDVESDGLHGEGFAVGAVLGRLTAGGVEIIDTFSGMAELDSISNEWVTENVIPGLMQSDIPLFKSRRDLRDAFFSFYKKAKETAEIWADCVWPVEANFMSQVIADGNGARDWDGPYPFKDLATLLPMDVSREEFSGVVYDHNPVNDATASIHCLQKVLFGAK